MGADKRLSLTCSDYHLGLIHKISDRKAFKHSPTPKSGHRSQALGGCQGPRTVRKWLLIPETLQTGRSRLPDSFWGGKPFLALPVSLAPRVMAPLLFATGAGDRSTATSGLAPESLPAPHKPISLTLSTWNLFSFLATLTLTRKANGKSIRNGKHYKEMLSI
jgi:hypothetical protein